MVKYRCAVLPDSGWPAEGQWSEPVACEAHSEAAKAYVASGWGDKRPEGADSIAIAVEVADSEYEGQWVVEVDADTGDPRGPWVRTQDVALFDGHPFNVRMAVRALAREREYRAGMLEVQRRTMAALEKFARDRTAAQDELLREVHAVAAFAAEITARARKADADAGESGPG